ncbi:hypothetical protein INR49_026292, partial [Caranx melampygus]
MKGPSVAPCGISRTHFDVAPSLNRHCCDVLHANSSGYTADRQQWKADRAGAGEAAGEEAAEVDTVTVTASAVNTGAEAEEGTTAAGAKETTTGVGDAEEAHRQQSTITGYVTKQEEVNDSDEFNKFTLGTHQDESADVQEEDDRTEVFSRRKLESNWDRYAESERQEPDDDTPTQRGTDYLVLLESAASVVSVLPPGPFYSLIPVSVGTPPPPEEQE